MTTAESVESRDRAELRAALGQRAVVLVGMMGSGKSSVGKRLATRIGLPFIDADTEIETAAGSKMVVPEIVWAKLRSLSEGALIATMSLFG